MTYVLAGNEFESSAEVHMGGVAPNDFSSQYSGVRAAIAQAISDVENRWITPSELAAGIDNRPAVVSAMTNALPRLDSLAADVMNGDVSKLGPMNAQIDNLLEWGQSEAGALSKTRFFATLESFKAWAKQAIEAAGEVVAAVAQAAGENLRNVASSFLSGIGPGGIAVIALGVAGFGYYLWKK